MGRAREENGDGATRRQTKATVTKRTQGTELKLDGFPTSTRQISDFSSFKSRENLAGVFQGWFTASADHLRCTF